MPKDGMLTKLGLYKLAARQNRFYVIMACALLCGIAALWSAVGLLRAAPLLLPPTPAFRTIEITPKVVAPGANVLYTIPFYNTGDPATGVLTFTLPVQMDFVSATPGYVQNGNVVTWTVTVPTGNSNTAIYYTVTASLQSGSVLHDFLNCNAKLTLGTTTAQSRAVTDHYVINATDLKKSATALVVSGNTLYQAVAGETVTVTALYTVPIGTRAYTVTPKVLLQDGLMPYASSPAWDALYIGERDSLRVYDAQANSPGVLVVFPNQGDIDASAVTQTVVITLYARQMQFRPVAGTELAQNNTESVQAILRWCGQAACNQVNDTAYYFSDTSGNGQVTLVRPIITLSSPSATYLDADGLGAGGGLVRLTIPSLNTGGRPTAYDPVFTTTLGPGLTYVGSAGQDTGAGVESAGPGDVTYVAWNVPGSLDGSEIWTAVITASLPTSFVVGQEFTYTTVMQHETFAGDVISEGVYLDTGAQVLRPGVAHSKTSQPASGNVTMGNYVTYTVILKQAANTLLQAPHYTDTLPMGFHYVSGTLVVENASASAPLIARGASRVQSDETKYFEDLGWMMADLPVNASARIITATFVAHNTGWDYNHVAVWNTANDMKSARTTLDTGYTGALLSWTPPVSSTYATLARANSPALSIIQPFMAESFVASRTDSGVREVGGSVNLRISFRNNGSGSAATAIKAQEFVVCDTLPQGLMFTQDNGCKASNGTTDCPFTYTSPTPNSTGKICWTAYGVPKGDAYAFNYQALVTPAVIPGYLTNSATVEEYTSLVGEVEGERRYSEIYYKGALPGLPLAANCGAQCIEVRGLAATKTAHQAAIEPGDFITYTLAYTNTTGGTVYTGVGITDTYDTYLAYHTASPAPSSVDTVNHRLVWNVGTLNAGANGQILLTLRVQDPLPDGVTTLTNKMQWNSKDTAAAARERIVVTPLDVANLAINMNAPDYAHAAGNLVYTVVYTNVGPTARPVTLTFGYDTNLDFSSFTGNASRSADNIFTDDAPPNTTRRLTVTLQVKAPLDYAVAQVHSDVEITSPGATSKRDEATTLLNRPQFGIFRKSSTASVAPDVGQTVVYTFALQNTGDFTATGCTLQDMWDVAKMSFLAGDDWTPSGATATWDPSPFSLSPGEATYPGMLTLNVTTNSNHYENQLAVKCDQVENVPVYKHDLWKASIETYKTASDVIAFPGRIVTYTVSYTNSGASPVANAVITDYLPAGITLVGYTDTGMAGCSAVNFSHGSQAGAGGGTDVFWKCVYLDAGASGTVAVWGEVTGVEGTNIVNTTASDGDAPPYRPGTVEVELPIARPRLTLTQTLSVVHPEYNNVAPGDLFTYTFTYHNRGTALENAVVFKVHLPTTQVAYVSSTHGGSYASGAVTWSVGDVDAGASGVVYLVLRALDVPGQQVVFSGSDLEIASQRINDAQDDDETIYVYPVTVTINDWDLSIVKDAVAPSLSLNALVTYTVTLDNVGGGTLTHVMFTDTLDGYLTVLSAPGCVHSGGAIPATTAGGVLTCTIGTLDQHTPIYTVTLVSRLGSLPTNTSFPNTAWAYSDQTPSEASNRVWVGSGAPNSLSIEVLNVSPETHHAPATFAFLGSASGLNPKTYVWFYGDGGGKTESGNDTSSAVHSYAMSGTYQVVMSVTNSLDTDWTAIQITVTGEPEVEITPPGHMLSLLEGASAQRSLAITNTAGATDLLHWTLAENPARDWLTPSLLSGVVQPGAADSVGLEFGTAALAPGVYTTSLEIASNDPDEPLVIVPIQVTINALCKPVTAVTLTKTTAGSVAPGGQVAFSAAIEPQDATKPYSYSINYKDGTSILQGSSSANPLTFNHTFSAAGTYLVELAVWNCGQEPVVSTVSVSVVAPCDAVSGVAFTFAPSAPLVGQTVAFTGTVAAGTGPFTYTWNFGDASAPLVSTLATAQHAFAAVGAPNVILTVTHACDASFGQYSAAITIADDGYAIYLPIVLKAAP